jgi:hypothetical protein
MSAIYKFIPRVGYYLSRMYPYSSNSNYEGLSWDRVNLQPES